jgi:hypothetical protein
MIWLACPSQCISASIAEFPFYAVMHVTYCSFTAPGSVSSYVVCLNITLLLLLVILLLQGCIKLLVEARLDLRKGIAMFAAPSATNPSAASTSAPSAAAAVEHSAASQHQQEPGVGSGGAGAAEEQQAGADKSVGRAAAAAAAGATSSRGLEGDDAEECALDSSLQEQVAQTMRDQQQVR